MRIQVEETNRVGQAIDLRGTSIRATHLVAAIRDPADGLVIAPQPTPVSDHLEPIRPGMEFDCRVALAAAGRSNGLESPHSTAIARLERRIESIDPETPDLRAARRRAAEAGEDVAALEEQVARTSGRVNARQEAELPVEELEEQLAALTRELTEAETEAIAAREALSRAEAEATSARDDRADRLSLVDRRENRRRAAREWFLDVLADPFERALRGLPVGAEPAPPSDYTGPSHEAALAIARIADLMAPVVLVDGPFETPVTARAGLDAPVILARV